MTFSVLGKTTQGANPGSGNRFPAGGPIAIGTFSLPGAATLIRAVAQLWGPSSSASDVKVLMYDNTGSGGAPGVILATSDPVSVSTNFSAAGHSVTFPFNGTSGVHLASGAVVYLGLLSDIADGGPLSPQTGTMWEESPQVSTYASPASPMPNPTSRTWPLGNGDWILYVEYHLDTDPDFAPVNDVAPAVTGTAAVGNTLLCVPGTWEGWPISISYSYQWQISADVGQTFSDVVGATSSSYTVQSADRGFAFRCNVTATNSGGSTLQASNTVSYHLDFPLGGSSASRPVPSGFTRAVWNDAGNHRCGTFYEGEPVVIRLAASGPTSYEVRDFYGNIVSSGSVSGTSFRPTPPNGAKGYGVFGGAGGVIGEQADGGGWPLGWYRVYFKGDSDDSLYGTSLGSTHFAVVRNNPNMLRMRESEWLGSDVPWDHGINDVYGAFPDVTMLAVYGVGSARTEPAYNDTVFSEPSGYTAQVKNVKDLSLMDAVWSGAVNTDPHRPRYIWCAWNTHVDRLDFNNQADTTKSAIFYPKDQPTNAVSGSIYIQVEAGTSSGHKVTVRYPDPATVVETYDNIADNVALESATASSSYIRVYAWEEGVSGDIIYAGPTAIGQAVHDGVAHMVAQGLPYSVYHEGPLNEPPTSGVFLTSIVHECKLFRDCVAAAGGKAIGPTSVRIDTAGMWTDAIAGGLPQVYDEVSTHAYNATIGTDIALARHTIGGWISALTAASIDTDTLWQTESTQSFPFVYGVFHPRKCRDQLFQWLVFEQYGIPKERNNPWYATSHGFWSFPAFMACADTSITPAPVLSRVWAEEVFSKTHFEQLDFGSPGNNLYIGSVFRNPTDGTSVVCVMASSYFPDGTVKFNVSGTTDPLIWSDGFGKTGTLVQSSGVVTLPVTDIPSYLRLPAGATVTVAGVNGYAVTPTVQVTATTCTVGSTSTSIPIDGQFMSDYGKSVGIYFSPNPLPENVTIGWTNPTTVNRVCVYTGGPWQNVSSLLDFDVQTTSDGSVWVTRATVDRTTTATSFKHGCDSNTTGCLYETYWEQPGCHDIGFSAVSDVIGVRLVVRQTSYGGEPDFQTSHCGGGQGSTSQHIVLQEVQIFDSPSA